MSSHHKEIIACPKCSHESEFLLWDSINTMLNPEMKMKVRNGDAFKWVCPNCGHQAQVDYTTLYHQMEDHFMIYYVTGNNEVAVSAMKNLVPNEFKAIGSRTSGSVPQYRNRVVSTMNQFREKLMIFDEGLDDHVIELMKFILYVSFQKDDPKFNIEELLFEANADYSRRFVVRTSDGSWGSAAFSMDFYRKMQNTFEDYIRNDKEVIVDFDWAKQAYLSMKSN